MIVTYEEGLAEGYIPILCTPGFVLGQGCIQMRIYVQVFLCSRKLRPVCWSGEMHPSFNLVNVYMKLKVYRTFKRNMASGTKTQM